MLHPDVCGGVARRAARGALAVQAVQPGRLPGRRSSPATRRWSRELLEVRKHAGMIVPAPVQAAMVAALGDDAHVRRAARALPAPGATCCAPRSSAAGFAVDALRGRALPVGDPRRGLLGRRCDWLAGRGILVAPGDFYGAGRRARTSGWR